MPRIDEKKLINMIKEKGQSWKAGRTSLSELPFEEQKKRLGLAVKKEDLEKMRLEIKAAVKAFSFPQEWDWRNARGKNWTTSIKDQSSCGSCVSFAVCAVMESMMKIEEDKHDLSIDLSEAHLFFCGCGRCCNTGWTFEPALDYAKGDGISDEACFPYRATDTNCNERCSDWDKRSSKITEWKKITNVSERKNVLSSVGPLVGGMAVYEDFFSYRGGVYRHVTGDFAGYHAIAIVGFSESEQCWICKNSWGSGWGENGWFKIGYGECDIDTTFPMYSVTGIVPAPPQPPQPECLIATAAYGSVLSPEVQFLRDVRDNIVRKTEKGNKFMDDAEYVYYKFSPQVVYHMKRSKNFKKFVRWTVVAPFVYSVYGIMRVLVDDERLDKYNLDET
ncbi:MAG: peptidase C1 [Thermoplasmata archaeon]|nr:MAG: peptidase C1 [Thermoplasmata archaeon]